jgi:flagellar biosynthesis/type III secretory pathway chaperone
MNRPNQSEHPQTSNAYVPQLRQMLTAQEKVSTEFCRLLEDEKKSLVSIDIPSLVEITRKKGKDLSRIQRLDENIQEMIRRIVSGKGKSTGPIKLSETIPFLDQNEALMVKEYQKKLSRLRTAIVTANHVNQKFTMDTLGYLNDAVSLICKGIVSNPLYNTDRKEQMSKNTPALVSREV